MDEKPSIKIKKSRIKKEQSAFEFITTYGWAILILAVVITLLYYFIGIPSTSVPNKCQFLFGSNCQGIIATSLASSTKMTLVITNAQSYPIFNPLIKVATDSYGNLSAACLPSNALVNPGSEIICNVTIPQKISPGTTITGTIYLNITACPSGNIKNCQPEQLQTYKGNIITRVTSQSSNIHLTSTSTSSTSTSSTSTSSTSTSSTSTTTSTSTSTSTIGCGISPVSYSTPGGPYLVTVPTGCSSATVTLAGGGGGGGGDSILTYETESTGGSSFYYCEPFSTKFVTGTYAVDVPGGAGGNGASLSGNIIVTSGETLYVWVGGGGGGGSYDPTTQSSNAAGGAGGVNNGGGGGNGATATEYASYGYCPSGGGGGGGGMSAIGTTSSSSGWLAVAAGGGGGGGGAYQSPYTNPEGGNGGYSGSSGSNGYTTVSSEGTGGSGATLSSVGSGGNYGGSAGSSSSGGAGAAGFNVHTVTCSSYASQLPVTGGGAGGGGAGYYGGGSGGSNNGNTNPCSSTSGGGGGGGSTWWSGSFAESSYNANSVTGGAVGCYYVGGFPLSCYPGGSSGNNGMVTITWS